MSDYGELRNFLSDNLEIIVGYLEEEAAKNENFTLRKYIFFMHKVQLDLEELQLKYLAHNAKPEKTFKKAYFRQFNLITDIIEQLKQENDMPLKEKTLLALKTLQKQAEELYLQQGDDGSDEEDEEE